MITAMDDFFTVPLLFSAALSLPILAGLIASIVQYFEHRAPLKAIDGHVRYSYFHHLRIVTIPLLMYRYKSKFIPPKT